MSLLDPRLHAADAEFTPAPAGLCEGEAAYLAYEDVLHRKFRHWRGQSGRAYIFTVYAADDCPAYEDAVLIVARGQGEAAPLACVDLGRFPEATLEAMRARFCGRQVEFQIHVLTARGADRRALIADVRCARRGA